MKVSNRFDAAINKLYTAFNNNTLNPEDCKQCAVGNILDNTDAWQHLTDMHGSQKLNYVGLVHQTLGRKFNGYAPLELLKIESHFLKGCGYKLTHNFRLKKPENYQNKAILFNGLCEAIRYMCQLDGIDNIMDLEKSLYKPMDSKIEEKSLTAI